MPDVPPLVDHIVWIVPDLDRTASQLRDEHGVEPTVGGRHPAHGTRNVLVRLGDRTYLEILSIDPEADPAARSPRGQMVASVTEPRLHEVLLHVADFDVLEQGDGPAAYRVTGVFPGSRTRPDGSTVEWRRAELATPTGEKLPDVIRWVTPHPAEDLPTVASLEELALGAERPEEVRAALAALGSTDGLAFEGGGRSLRARVRTPGGSLALSSAG